MVSLQFLRVANRLRILAFIFALGSQSWAQADQPATDRDVGKFEFIGNTVFSADNLRQALLDDPQIQFATRPFCSLETFQKTLEQRLKAGYLQYGYSKPKIHVHQNDQISQVTVEIDAGQKFHAGRLEVTGSDHISARALEDWILNPRPKSDAIPVRVGAEGKTTQWITSSGAPSALESPLWKPNDAVSFHPPKREECRKEIVRFCHAQGYFEAIVTATVREESDGTATLVVAVDDEGPQSCLEEITIVGLKRNQHEELIEFLQLKRGMPVTKTLYAELQYKFFECGKYLEHKVKFETAGETNFSLHIEVYENELASPLNQPRSDVEEAACRLAGWLNRLTEVQEDLIIESTSNLGLRAIWSISNQVLLAEYIQRPLANAPIQYGIAVLADRSGIVVSALHRGENLVLPRFNGQVTVYATEATSRPNKHGHKARLAIGTGVRSSPPGQLPVAAVLLLSPAAMINDFLKPGREVKIQNGRVLCTGAQFHLEMEFETGRLLEYVIENEECGSMRISTTVNQLQSAIEEHLQRVNGFKSVFDPKHPCTSVLRFGLNLIDPVYLPVLWPDKDDAEANQSNNSDSIAEVETIPDADELCNYWQKVGRIKRGLEVLRTFAKPEILQPFDLFLADLIRRVHEKVGDKFATPPEDDVYSFIFGDFEKLAALLLNRDSWGCRVTHDWNLVVNNWRSPAVKIIYAGLIADTESEKLGPLGAYYSMFFDALTSSHQNSHIEQAALKQVTLSNVKRDANQLLVHDTPLTEVLTNLMASIADCSPEEWEDFVFTMALQEFQSFAVDARRICCEHKQNPQHWVSELIERKYPDVIEPALRSHFIKSLPDIKPLPNLSKTK